MTFSYIDFLTTFGVGGAHPGGLKLTKELLSRELIEDTTSILDVGCSTGQTSAYIAQKYGCQVISLGSNKVMLEKAKQRFLSLQLPIEVKEGNTERLPFNDDLFDFIISESVTAFTNVSLSIPEYKRVLKPTGTLLAVEMVLEKKIPQEEHENLREFYGFSKLFLEEEWRSLFHETGFTDVQIQKASHNFDENDVSSVPDFLLSEDIDEEIYRILEKHESYTKMYNDILGFRVFRCST